jgi:hypothetical protein
VGGSAADVTILGMLLIVLFVVLVVVIVRALL